VLATPDTIAIDFDGVICNGLAEYFQTAWKTYHQYWSNPIDRSDSEIRDGFYQLRPVIETGWEMPILVQALLMDIPHEEIVNHWVTVRDRIVENDAIDPQTLAYTLDQLRDDWIATDLDGWLALHEFYPGTIEQLQAWTRAGIDWWIVTTKEGRFVKRLLGDRGIEIELGDRLFGKEVGRPKYQTLRQLRHDRPIQHRLRRIWFVEDRLKTLQAVDREPDLGDIELFFADWGYSTSRERADSAVIKGRIRSISIDQFCGDLTGWIEAERFG
jgi:phosphoglycolate phosphatase-like HAD superfamily hydrolase